METVEVLIRIPKHDYYYILSQGDTRGTPHLAEAIRNGIVLPKKHGRLIDADAVLEDPYGNTYKDINIAETIIEADKDGQDER